MLIDFTIENYRSIRSPVTLSLVAQAGRKREVSERPAQRAKKQDHEIAPPFVVEGRAIELLPAVSIFGANASGKSNVVRALDDVLSFMLHGASRESSYLSGFNPFRLDATTSEEPSRFELRIVRDGVVFIYLLSADQKQVFEERLEYIPAEAKQLRKRLLFHRIWERTKQKYIWKNGADLGTAYVEIEEALQDHEPFVSFLVSRLKVAVVGPLSSWLRHRWAGLTLGWEGYDRHLAMLLLGDVWPERQRSVIEMIKAFDTGISSIEIEKVQSETTEGVDASFRVWAHHLSGAAKVRWPLEEESTGTQRLFSLTYKMLHVFEHGALAIVDELGSNIHPNIVREIVRLFQNPHTNPKRAQLVFTSHDNTLQRGNLLRRDQIWFTQKLKDGSTDLYPLTDFHPRNDLALDKAYLDGRFGAVPIIPAEEDLQPVLTEG
jgi:AAA15 family ATPase/GTPase